VHLNQKGSYSFVGVLSAQQEYLVFGMDEVVCDHAQEDPKCHRIGVNSAVQSASAYEAKCGLDNRLRCEAMSFASLQPEDVPHKLKPSDLAATIW
jgi:hypothetical protein